MHYTAIACLDDLTRDDIGPDCEFLYDLVRAPIWQATGIDIARSPRDGQRPDIDPDDRPYAATLLLGLAQQVRDGDRLAVTRLQLGIVGPSAQGEMAQDALHHLFGRERFRGWDNQVGDLPP